jgi:hypothetical protein
LTIRAVPYESILNLTTTTTRGIEAMPKRKPEPSRAVPSRQSAGSAAELRAALTRRKKVELVDVLMELAEADRGFLRQLTARFEVMVAPDDLVAATRQAIADATAFDKRDINRNFAYDHHAYSEVKRNLSRLIGSGQLRQAMPLALELMKRGSYQVEMSDEGMMTEDVEEGVNVVIEALRKSDLPAAEVIAWCSAMLESDRVGFVARELLEALRRRVQAAKAQ